MILFATLIHYIWGIVTILPPGEQTTGTSSVKALFGGDDVTVGVIFLIAAFCASIALCHTFERTWLNVLLVMPQQLLLLVSSIGAIECVWAGQFADGIVRSHEFILEDQAPIIILCYLHAVAIIAAQQHKPPITVNDLPPEPPDSF